MSDYSFMKSGFNNLVTQQDENFEQNITVLISTFASEGLKHASRYVSHHKTRYLITPEDIKRGMMLEVFIFKNRPDLVDKFDEILQIISQESDSDEDEEEEIEERSEETFTENDCSCPICKCMNTIYTRWEKFVPSSPLEQIIKTNIDKIQL